MASAFPGSPRVQKGGIVAYQLPELIPTIVVFQYNPDEVTRQIEPNSAQWGGGRGDVDRLNGPPTETLSLSVEIDAADQLEFPRSNGVTVAHGLHPVLAALEQLAYPPLPVMVANEMLALAGSAFIAAEKAPLALLVWGVRRVLPVQLTALSIKEQSFDPALNPIRATADLQLRVLTHRDVDPLNPGYWVYAASLAQKEVMAGINTFADAPGIRSMLPV
ncbi:MAG TPA: hypothetical protein VF704_10780 [Allosphingosinicella sp.]|jgi:hypothetical protein